jgi:hypothetical protein
VKCGVLVCCPRHTVVMAALCPSSSNTLAKHSKTGILGRRFAPMRVLRCSGILRQCSGPLQQQLRCQPLLPLQHAARHITRAAVDTVAPSTASAAADASSSSPQASSAYPFAEIEAKWQQYWEEQQTFRTPEDLDTSKPKYYVLDMFPYPRCAAGCCN